MAMMEIMDGVTFWTDAEGLINEFKAMANNRLISLLEKSDGKVNFPTIRSNTDPMKIRLNEMYEGGVCVEFCNESTKSFKSLSVEEMMKLIQMVEKMILSRGK